MIKECLWWIMLLFLFLLLVLIILILLYCYFQVFYVNRKQTLDPYLLPEGDQYDEVRSDFLSLIDRALVREFQDVSIISFDGLKLSGRLYKGSSEKNILLMIHGYRANSYRDFCGGLNFGLDNGYSVLVVDHRAHGKSEGSFLTFGIKEKYDVLSWVNYISQEIPESKITLFGISMGAATALMSTGLELPENVTGCISDSSYDSVDNIIDNTIIAMHLPLKLTHFFVRISGRILAGVDIADGDVTMSLANCHIPVLLIHGTEDLFVPCEMSKHNYDSIPGSKAIELFENAGHGLSYMVDPERFISICTDFLNKTNRI